MPRTGDIVRSTPDEIAHTRALVLQYGWNSMAYQILNPGIRRWFSTQFDAVIGYVEAGGYRVVAGAPVCAPECLSDVATAFAEDTQRAGKRLCYFGAQERLISSMEWCTPASALLLGAQPSWDPAGWPAIIGGKASLRAQLSRARNKHVEIHEWPAEQATDHPELRRCLSEWLGTRGLPPMRFLVEWNILPRLLDRRVWVAQREGQVVGYLIATPVPLRQGWLVEQIIRGAKAPNGTNELLLDAAMRTLGEAG
ncbi:MAG TPA: phosphatidylglycerol lysyltransferase domain-containing protein, partial [Roseiflexaceae bacterium]|nr:phosphatidylglycerol lysyltransferase domain-containing protein [Roseiflexaceae bacterium]